MNKTELQNILNKAPLSRTRVHSQNAYFDWVTLDGKEYGILTSYSTNVAVVIRPFMFRERESYSRTTSKQITVFAKENNLCLIEL